jgi:hypothetical protein
LADAIVIALCWWYATGYTTTMGEDPTARETGLAFLAIGAAVILAVAATGRVIVVLHNRRMAVPR